MIPLFRSLFAPPRHLILVLAALWLGLALAEKRAERHNLSKDILNSLVFYSLFGYILGGRALYVLSHFAAFAQSPLSLFSLNPDLFDPLGGLVAAALVAFAYGQQKKLFLWPTLDALTPLFGLVWFRKTDSPSGIPFLTFTALTAGARLFLEAFRGDSTLVFGALRLTQIIAWVVLAVSLFASESLMKEKVK